MKKLITLTVMMLLTSLLMAQTPVKKVAVMATKAADGVSEFQSQMVRGAMESAVVTAKGYEGYDRTAFDAIMQEHNFQRSGAVDESQIKQMGQMAGVQYVLVTEASQEDGYFYIIAKLLDVETGQYSNAYDVLCKQSPTDIKESCAELGANMFGGGSGSRKSNVNMIPVEQIAEVSITNTTNANENMVERPKYISKIRNGYYMDGRRLTEKRYMDMINECYESQMAYKRGKTIKTAGWITLGCGAALAIAGFAGVGETTSTSSDFSFGEDGSSSYTTTSQSTRVLAIVGVGVGLASIPVFIWGKNVRNNAYKEYNSYCAKPAAKLSLNVKDNGLGICLNF